MMRKIAVLLAFLSLVPGTVRAAERPALSSPIQVVPSRGLPASVVDNRSNNNLHTIMHRGRLFMVFRTAKWHLASDDAVLYVVSTKDQVRWAFEGAFRFGRDLREPRLLSWRGQLFLYFALLGANPVAFEPGGTMVTRRLGPGRWTTPRRILFDDFIPWGVKLYRGTPYMLGYTGGGGTFTPDPPPKDVYWLTTSDGFRWRAVVPGHAVVYRGGCAETDFDFLENGTLVTACQTENKDALGWGAKVCTAPATNTARWTCRGDPRRLDSPFVFTHGDAVYVIARRQPYFNGDYDLHLAVPEDNARFAAYDALYAGTPKRCALWLIEEKTRRFMPVMDIPGLGDTCYPSVLPRGRDRYLVYNYTSPLDGPDVPWGIALFGNTIIYRTTLTFAGR